ncbi:unnamed protein product, partial [Polarella glacialis]
LLAEPSLVQQSLSFAREARDLDRPALSRLLNGLQERLEREQNWRQTAEVKLSVRRASSAPSLESRREPKGLGSLHFERLGPSEKANALNRSRASGLFWQGAAGCQPIDRLMERFNAVDVKVRAKPAPSPFYTDP